MVVQVAQSVLGGGWRGSAGRSLTGADSGDAHGRHHLRWGVVVMLSPPSIPKVSSGGNPRFFWTRRWRHSVSFPLLEALFLESTLAGGIGGWEAWGRDGRREFLGVFCGIDDGVE